MTERAAGADTSDDEGPRLWTNASRTRYFLVPFGTDLPQGDLPILAFGGHELRVDPRALTRYEIGEAEAFAWTRTELNSVLRRLGDNLKSAVERSAAREPRHPEAEGGDAAGPQRRPTPGLDLLADLTDRPREELAGDYAAMGRALREHLGSLGRAALDSVSGDPERMAAAQARMAGWNETLKANGVDASADDRTGAGNVEGGDVSDSPRSAGESGADRGHTEQDPSAEPPGAAPRQSESRARGPDIASELRAMAAAMRRRADALAAAREAARGSSATEGHASSTESDTRRKNPTGGGPHRP
jgi:hypothetical protein